METLSIEALSAHTFGLGSPEDQTTKIGCNGIKLVLDAVESVIGHLAGVEKGTYLLDNLAFDSRLKPELAPFDCSKSCLEAADAGVKAGEAGVDVGDAGVEVGDAGVEVGDAGVEVGDAGIEVGDPRIEVGDPRVEVGDSQIKTGNARAEVSNLRYELCLAFCKRL